MVGTTPARVEREVDPSGRAGPVLPPSAPRFSRTSGRPNLSPSFMFRSSTRAKSTPTTPRASPVMWPKTEVSVVPQRYPLEFFGESEHVEQNTFPHLSMLACFMLALIGLRNFRACSRSSRGLPEL